MVSPVQFHSILKETLFVCAEQVLSPEEIENKIRGITSEQIGSFAGIVIERIMDFYKIDASKMVFILEDDEAQCKVLGWENNPEQEWRPSDRRLAFSRCAFPHIIESLQHLFGEEAPCLAKAEPSFIVIGSVKSKLLNSVRQEVDLECYFIFPYLKIQVSINKEETIMKNDLIFDLEFIGLDEEQQVLQKGQYQIPLKKITEEEYKF